MVLKDLLIGIKNMHYDLIFYTFLIQILFYFIFRKKLLKSLIAFKLVDRPGKNKIHKNTVPIAGGLLVFFSLILYLFSNFFFSYFGNNLIDKRITIFLFGTFFFFFIGLIDDIFNLKAKNKIIIVGLFNLLLFQNSSFFNTNLLIFNNFIISGIIHIFSLSILFTIIGFLTYHYSLVIMDGINGLFGSYIIILLLLLFLFFELDYKLKSLIFYLILSLFFVTVLNYKGNLFFGNSGSLMMGTIIPYLLLYIYNIRENPFTTFTFLSLTIIPILDMCRLFFIRTLSGRSPFAGDLNHFHHLLTKRFSLSISLIVYLLLCFLPFIIIYQFYLDPLLMVFIQILFFFILINYLKKVN